MKITSCCLVRQCLYLLFLLCLSAVPAAAQNKAVNDVLYVLPLIVVTIIIIVIAILVACVMYKAKRGYFCCLKPTPYRYPRSAMDDDSDSEASEEQNTPENLPSYQNNRPRVAPPDYRDAMQDPLVENNSPAGNQHQATGLSEVTETALTTPTAVSPPPASESPIPPLLPPPPPPPQHPASPPPPTNETQEPAANDQPQEDTPAMVQIELDDGAHNLLDVDDLTPLNP